MLQTLCSVITPINKTNVQFWCIVRNIWREIHIIHLCYCATVRKCRRKKVAVCLCAWERDFLCRHNPLSGDETARTAVHQNKLFLESLYLLTVIYNIIYAGWVLQNYRICYFQSPILAVSLRLGTYNLSAAGSDPGLLCPVGIP